MADQRADTPRTYDHHSIPHRCPEDCPPSSAYEQEPTQQSDALRKLVEWIGEANGASYALGLLIQVLWTPPDRYYYCAVENPFTRGGTMCLNPNHDHGSPRGVPPALACPNPQAHAMVRRNARLGSPEDSDATN